VKTEAILQELVVSVSEQNSLLNNQRLPHGYDSAREGIEGLAVGPESSNVPLWGGLDSHEPLADIATSSPNVQTRDETAAVQRIISEAEEKLIHHGRTAVLDEWRRNSVKVRWKPSSGIGVASHVHRPDDRIRMETPPEEKQPGAKHIGHVNHSPQSVVVKKASAIGALAASVNYMPNVIVNRAFLACKDAIEGTKRWPASFQQWIRVAEWWFLKVG
jgi:hypothetical protein